MTAGIASLQYNVSQLLKSAVGDTRTYEFASDEPLSLDDATARQIRGSVKFTLTNFEIIASGEVQAIVDQPCARCLEDFSGPISVQFQGEYQPSIDITTGLPSAQLPNDDAFDISSSHVIDLTEVIRQQLLLAVEMVPVCRPDCRGLCPTCGVNLNSEQCACPPQEEPSPFSVLQGLLIETES